MNLVEAQAHVVKIFEGMQRQTVGQVRSVSVEDMTLPNNGPEFHGPSYKITIELETADPLEGF